MKSAASPQPQPHVPPLLSCSGLSYRLPDGVQPSSTRPLLSKLRYLLDPSSAAFRGPTLLRNVSFSLPPNRMIALMGPSGAGKSTLLDVLSHRKSNGTVYGSILNTSPSSCYVQQSDCHIDNLTVYETLNYASLLRNPKSWTQSQHTERIDYLITAMGLAHVSTSFVGSSFTRGISGGQLKRLSIAVESITLPSLIFLDEPTSGLDSSISLEVMSAVRKLCDEGGRAVICTIHQPSIDTFELFDELLLLSEGRVIYNGRREGAKGYFNELGYVNEKDSNPADFICEVAGGMVCGGGLDPNVSYGESHVKTPRELEKLFKSSSYYKPVTIDPNSSDSAMPKSPNNTWTQFKTLLSRGILTNKRNKAYRNSQIVKNIIVGILAGVIFYQQGSLNSSVWNTQTDFPESAGYNVVSILYFAILYSITGNLQAIPMLFQQKLMFVRERESGAYTTLPYWMCNR
jgi:ABC-type multidrug transport system ATPase subunit